jgi:dipeptidyl aminopeptidase/acylaminoacyl peptidase
MAAQRRARRPSHQTPPRADGCHASSAPVARDIFDRCSTGALIAPDRVFLPHRLLRRLVTVRAAPCAVSAEAERDKAASLSFVRGASVILASADGKRLSTVRRKDAVYAYTNAAWSGDGRCLAFAATITWPDVHTEYSVGVSRAGRTIIPAESSNYDFLYAFASSWAPDGHRLALSEYGGLLEIDGVGSATTVFLAGDRCGCDRTYIGASAWSPNDNWIAFQQCGSLYLIRPDRTRLHRVAADGADPNWSPDSQRLVFAQAGRIATIDADGTHLHYLTRPTGTTRDSDPAWSPDGRTIAFVRNKAIWLVDATGANQRLFIKNATAPAWKPN